MIKKFSKELSSKPQQKMNLIQLAILALNEDECNDAQLCLDPDSIGALLPGLGEIGQAILGRRNIITA